MIEYITRLKCDGCGKAEDEPAWSTFSEILERAETHGWWVSSNEGLHYCPVCKLAARLDMGRLEGNHERSHSESH